MPDTNLGIDFFAQQLRSLPADPSSSEIVDLLQQILKTQIDTNQRLTKLEDNVEGLRKHDLPELHEKLATFQRALGHYAISARGEVPIFDLVTKLACQIWYNPNITKDELALNKTMWSMRLTITAGHRKLPQEINVPLYPYQVWKAAGKKNDGLPRETRILCDVLEANGGADDYLCGFVKAFTDAGGRPYVKTQAMFMRNHMIDTTPSSSHPEIRMVLGEHWLEFTPVRPSAGTQKGKSLWYCDWRKSKQPWCRIDE